MRNLFMMIMICFTFMACEYAKAADLYVMQGSRLWVSSSSSTFNFTENIKIGFGTYDLCKQGINNMRTEKLQQPDADATTPAMKNPDPNYGSFRQLLAVQCLQVN